MRQNTWPPMRTRRGRSAARSLLAGALLLPVAACDTLLDVSIPGQVEESELDDPALARTMVVSAIGEFECAYTSYVATTGILTGEYIVSTFWLASNIWGWRGDVEIRNTDGGCANNRDSSGFGYYTPLQRARFLADDGARRIAEFADEDVPDKTEMLAQLAVYGGYAYTLLGEGFCEMTIDESSLMTPAEVFDIAAERFTEGAQLAEAAGNDALRYAALAGRARVRLNAGDLDLAAADAEQIPEGFVWNAEYSEIRPRRENRLYNLTDLAYLSVGPDYRELEVQGQSDPRVPVLFTDESGHDGVTPQWDQAKYASRSAPIPMASWTEAQLILAEARGGQDAIDAINRVRASAGVPPLDPAAVQDVLTTVLEERRRQLFSEGRRYYDMLRHGIAFPSGTNHKGQSYGGVTCVPLPDVEVLNNPNVEG